MIGTVKDLIPKMLQLDETKLYKIDEYKEKRSLEANSYYWVLLTKMANVLRVSKKELHLRMLREYSQITIVCIPADKSIKGFAKYYEKDGAFKRGDNLFYTYKLYKPSSEMDSKEMSILIDGVVYEAKQLGIETLPPDKLEAMKSAWEASKENY